MQSRQRNPGRHPHIPIEAITTDDLRTRDASYALDVIVFATGFDAIPGPLLKIDSPGRGSERLADKWKDGPQTYLGLATAAFPDFFMITDPRSTCVLNNRLTFIEQHVDWMVDCIASMQRQGLTPIEAQTDAENAWVQTVHEVGHTTRYPRAELWYTGTNVPGKVRMFTPYAGAVGTYRRLCETVAEKGDEEFVFARVDRPARLASGQSAAHIRRS